MWTSVKVVSEDDFKTWFNTTSVSTDTTSDNTSASNKNNKTNADSTK
jgi:heme/copper-type cytochrome/quinol oxidase subunit 2